MSGKWTEGSGRLSPKSTLLTSIAELYFGDVAVQVITTLINDGRLTSKEISQRSKVPQTRVKKCLISLVEFNCVQYWESKATYYSLNEVGFLVLINSGTILEIVRKLYGEAEVLVMEHIIRNGNAVAKQFEETSLQIALAGLYKEGWLRRIQKIDCNPILDVWKDVYEDILRKTPRNPSVSESKRIMDVKERTKAKFNDLRDKRNTTAEVFTSDNGYIQIKPDIVLSVNIFQFEKHILATEFLNLARSRIGTITSIIYSYALSLIEKSIPEFNHPYLKIPGLLDDPELESNFLNSIENQLVDDRKTVFTVQQLAKVIPQNLDIVNSILTHNFLKPPSKKRANDNYTQDNSKRVKSESVKLGNSIEESITISNGASNNSISTKNGHENDYHSIDNLNGSILRDASEGSELFFLLEQHLKLLSSSTNIQFVIEISPGSYTIPFRTLFGKLKETYYESIVKKFLGTDSFRILRCLKKLKLVDERTIANSTLLRERAVRSELYHMTEANVIEFQEIPRSADRAVSKAFFLYRHNCSVSYKFLADSFLYCMAELYTEIEDLKTENSILLEKCEREDVKGNEKVLLLESEWNKLQEIRNSEINFVGKIGRIYSLYSIFTFV